MKAAGFSKNEYDTTTDDNSSIVSDTSAAVVSLYNSWSAATSDESMMTAEEDSSREEEEKDQYEPLPYKPSPPRQEHEVDLLTLLQERCRPEDIPRLPTQLRPRRRPVCLFINFMGTRKPSAPVPMMPRIDSNSDMQSQSSFFSLDEFESAAAHSDDTDDDADQDVDELFDRVVHVHKKPRVDDSPLSVRDFF
jgi:hypothetical protein